MSAPKRQYFNTAGNKATAHESTNVGLFDFGMVLLGEQDAFGFCPICFNRMDMNGANNEHILTPTEYLTIFGVAMTEDDYNDKSNKMQAHARCNSSKGTRGIFETWRESQPTGLSVQQYGALCSILDFHASHAKTSIGHFAKGSYKKQLQYIFSVVTGRTPETIERFVQI